MVAPALADTVTEPGKEVAKTITEPGKEVAK
jgi:hypothetical protein